MNDLELLRSFREDVPPPGERARLAALRAMTEAERRGSRSMRRSGRRWRVGVAIAAAVAMAIALPAILPSGRRGAAPDAAAALLRAAQVAATQDAVAAPQAGQFVYTKTKSVDANVTILDGGTSFSVLMPQVREAWIGTDGSGRLRETKGTPEFVSEQDRATWEAAGRPDLGANKTTDETFPAAAPDTGGMYFLDLSDAPTDTSELRKKIESREIEGGPSGDWETFTIIGDMLRETYTSPALRAALYRVAAGLRGVEWVGETEDPVGRDGIAVAYTHDGQRHELIFDQHTALLLGERYLVTDPSKAGFDVEPGAVVGWAAYIDSGIVDSTNERP